MHKRMPLFFTALMLVAAALAGCGQQAEDEASEALIVNVESTKAETGSLVLQNSFMGSVSPEDTVSVIPLVAGTVTEANFKVGDEVKAGDVLFRIDDTSAQLQLAQAQLGMASAQLQSSITLGPQHDLNLLSQQAAVDQINNQIASTAISIKQSKKAKKDYIKQVDELEDQKDSIDDSIKASEERIELLQKLSAGFVPATIDNLSKTEADKYPAEGGTVVKEEERNGVKVPVTYIITQKSPYIGEDKYFISYEPYQIYGMTSGEMSAAISSLTSAIESMKSAKKNLDASIDGIESAIDGYDSGIETAENTLDYLNRTKYTTEVSNAIQNGELLDSTKESMDIAEQNAQIAIDSTELALSYYTLTAPISGTIEQKNVKVNDLAATGYPAYVISSKDAMTVSFNVSEDIMHTLSIGDAVTVERNGTEYKGTVTEIQDAVNQATGLFLIKAQIGASGDALASGVSVKVTLDTYRADNALLIPYSAVYYDDGKAYVYTAENNTARKKYIETGIFDDEKIVVTSGLTASEEVITTWSPQLADGVDISITAKETE